MTEGITTTPPDVWQLDFDNMPDDGFTDGLRLSTDCLARRLIEPLDEARYFAFPEHLGKRGHGFERILQEWLQRNFNVIGHREVIVPWEYGESHLDLWVPNPAPAWDTGGRALQVEIKANKDAAVKTENVRQVQRQMFAVERAIAVGKQMRYRTLVDGEWEWVTIDPALYADAEWRIVVIDPTTWRIPAPKGVKVTIKDDRRAELEAEWATMIDVMSRPIAQLKHDIYWVPNIAPCTCGACDPDQIISELPRDLFENAASYVYARTEKADAASIQDYHGKVLKTSILVLEEKAPHLLQYGNGTSWSGGGYKVTLGKPNAKGTRSLNVTESDVSPSVQL